MRALEIKTSTTTKSLGVPVQLPSKHRIRPAGSYSDAHPGKRNPHCFWGVHVMLLGKQKKKKKKP